jgi:hypothetical protein
MSRCGGRCYHDAGHVGPCADAPTRLVAVKLDNPRFGSGPATVVAHPSSVSEYVESIRDRDGAHDATMRLWRTRDNELPPIGSRVSAGLVNGTGLAAMRPR